jgi:hypothetical protein
VLRVAEASRSAVPERAQSVRQMHGASLRWPLSNLSGQIRGLPQPRGRGAVPPDVVSLPLQALFSDLLLARPRATRSQLRLPTVLVPTEHHLAPRRFREALFVDHASL